MNCFLRASIAILLLVNESSAFVGPASPIASRGASSALSMMDVSSLSETSNALSTMMASSGLVLAETEPWVQPVSFVLGPFLNFLSFAMVSKHVMMSS
jgi:hypothetical protein